MRSTPGARFVHCFLCALGIWAAAGCNHPSGVDDFFDFQEVAIAGAPTTISIVAPTLLPNDQTVCDLTRHTTVTVTRGLNVEGSINVTVTGLPPGVSVVTCVYQPSGVVQRANEVVTIEDSPTRDFVVTRIDLFFEVVLSAVPGTFQLQVHAAPPSGGDPPDPVLLALSVQVPADVTPPTVQITSPVDQSIVTTQTVLLLGTASDDYGVVSLHYVLSGGTEQPVSAPFDSWLRLLTGLQPGPNTIEVIARDAAGNAGSDMVTFSYDPGSLAVACNQFVEATLTLGASANHVLLVPSGALAFAARLESVDLEGTYELPGVGASDIKPGEYYDYLNRVQPGTYSIGVDATTAGGTYRVSLECERPLSLDTDVSATQRGGLIQLYRFAATTAPIHIGVHRPQVLAPSLAGTIWYSAGEAANLNIIGNPTGGYFTGSAADTLPASTTDYTVLWEPLGVSAPGDVDEYTFAIATVAPPTALTLDASNSVTANGEVDHLGQLLYYSFTGVANESYTVVLDHPTGSLAAEVVVERVGAGVPFYQPAFLPLATGETTRDAAERTVTLGPFVLPADGTYTIRVGANASVTYDASLAETVGAFRLVLTRQ